MAEHSEEKGFILMDQPPYSDVEKISEGEQRKAEEAYEREAAKVEAAASKKAEPGEFQLPKIDFSTFIFSLNSSAYVQLGLLEDPAIGAKSKNLTLAKQTIDLLIMLEEKTRGNLAKEEETMLKHILYDLRILYVKEK